MKQIFLALLITASQGWIPSRQGSLHQAPLKQQKRVAFAHTPCDAKWRTICLDLDDTGYYKVSNRDGKYPRVVYDYSVESKSGYGSSVGSERKYGSSESSGSDSGSRSSSGSDSGSDSGSRYDTRSVSDSSSDSGSDSGSNSSSDSGSESDYSDGKQKMCLGQENLLLICLYLCIIIK